MNIDVLREFLDLAKTRSFTRTARTFNLSQPTLSRHIGALEHELGFKLLDRTTNNVLLTNAGKALFEGAACALEVLDKGVARAKAAAKDDAGAVCVGGCLQVGSVANFLYVAETIAHDLQLPLHLAQYAPHATDFTPDSARDDALDLLDAGTVDAVVIEGPEAFPELERFESLHVFNEPIVFFAHEGTELARRDSVAIADLQGKRFVGSLNYPQFQDRVREICMHRGFEPNIAVKMADTFNDFMRSANPEEIFFLSAHGAARVPDPPFSPLAKLKIDDPLTFAPVYLVWSHNPSPSVLNLVKAAQEFIRRTA